MTARLAGQNNKNTTANGKTESRITRMITDMKETHNGKEKMRSSQARD